MLGTQLILTYRHRNFGTYICIMSFPGSLIIACQESFPFLPPFHSLFLENACQIRNLIVMHMILRTSKVNF